MTGLPGLISDGALSAHLSVVVQFEILIHLHRGRASRKDAGGAKRKAASSLRLQRLGVSLPFPSSCLKLNHYPLIESMDIPLRPVITSGPDDHALTRKHKSNLTDFTTYLRAHGRVAVRRLRSAFGTFLPDRGPGSLKSHSPARQVGSLVVVPDAGACVRSSRHCGRRRTAGSV